MKGELDYRGDCGHGTDPDKDECMECWDEFNRGSCPCCNLPNCSRMEDAYYCDRCDIIYFIEPDGSKIWHEGEVLMRNGQEVELETPGILENLRRELSHV